MDRSWHLQSMYPILATRSYLSQSWHLSKLTMFNRKSNFKTCVAQNIPWVSHKLSNQNFLFKHCRIAEMKQILMRKCTSFSASRPIHRSLLSARTGSTRYHNFMLNKISSDCTSQNSDSVYRKPKLFFSQGLGYPNPYHWIFYCGNTPRLITLVRSVRYLVSLLRSALPYYSVELHPASKHCRGILYLVTLLRFTQALTTAQVTPTLIHCWVIPNFIESMSYTES